MEWGMLRNPLKSQSRVTAGLINHRDNQTSTRYNPQMIIKDGGWGGSSQSDFFGWLEAHWSLLGCIESKWPCHCSEAMVGKMREHVFHPNLPQCQHFVNMEMEMSKRWSLTSRRLVHAKSIHDSHKKSNAAQNQTIATCCVAICAPDVGIGISVKVVDVLPRAMLGWPPIHYDVKSEN